MIILASTSTTRQRLLTAAGISFRAVAPGIDEERYKFRNTQLTPAQLAVGLARAKAEAVAKGNFNDIVIGCDQVLACEGKIFDKAKSMDEALAHLECLQGKTHVLHTALCCKEGELPPIEFISEPNLTMRPMGPSSLKHYLSHAGPAILSSVGCYQIEGTGAQLFEAIQGDFFSVQGLPLLPLLAHLRKRGYIQA